MCAPLFITKMVSAFADGFDKRGRGSACVPARVALQGRIRCSSTAYNACIFGMETPLRGRLGGHAGAALTVSFGWSGLVQG